MATGPVLLALSAAGAGHGAEPADAHGAVAGAVHVAVGMIAVACVVGVLTKFVRVPYTIALVLVGLVIAMAGLAPAGVTITHDLVLLLFLPPLLFQAGLHLDLEHLRRAWAPVVVLAFPGVVITAAAVGAATRPVIAAAVGPEHATWAAALLLGVVLAPTDPISVVAAFRTAGAPEKLKNVVEGESLFNDGTAVAVYALLKVAVFGAAAGALATGGAPESPTFVDGALRFLFVSGVGTVVGLALGVAAFVVLQRLEDHTLETGITVALAWGAFVLAESVHASGVIAVAVAGLLMGNYGKVLTMSPETRTTLAGFWDSADFIVNSILFLLIGFELSDPAVGGAARLLDGHVLAAAGAALAAMLLARAALVYPTVLLLKQHWPKGWKHVVVWAGLRGSLSLALILGLPDGPLRRFFLPVAFVVVLVSLIGQGLTLPALMRRVDLGVGLPKEAG